MTVSYVVMLVATVEQLVSLTQADDVCDRSSLFRGTGAREWCFLVSCQKGDHDAATTRV